MCPLPFSILLKDWTVQPLCVVYYQVHGYITRAWYKGTVQFPLKIIASFVAHLKNYSFIMELSSEEKCAIDRDGVVGAVREAGKNSLIHRPVQDLRGEVQKWSERVKTRIYKSWSIPQIWHRFGCCCCGRCSFISPAPKLGTSSLHWVQVYTWSKVIVEQIHRSLQRKAKCKVSAFGPDASASFMLHLLDQFYSEEGVAAGDKILTGDYALKQGEIEDTSSESWNQSSRVSKTPERLICDQVWSQKGVCAVVPC